MFLEEWGERAERRGEITEVELSVRFVPPVSADGVKQGVQPVKRVCVQNELVRFSVPEEGREDRFDAGLRATKFDDSRRPSGADGRVGWCRIRDEKRLEFSSGSEERLVRRGSRATRNRSCS